jgi:hypothetical protein
MTRREEPNHHISNKGKANTQRRRPKLAMGSTDMRKAVKYKGPQKALLSKMVFRAQRFYVIIATSSFTNAFNLI